MDERKEIRRSLEEITASARMNMQDMINRAIGLGQDCIDAKEQLGHGRFLPWLKELGLSSSTASNYMRVAREIQPGSRLAGLSYSKALALLSAPAEDREALADETEGKSAAEIKRLIEERNRAAEAANVESARADQAEHVAADLQAKLKETERMADQRLEDLKQARELTGEMIKSHNDEISDLKAKLLTAENNRVEVEKVVEKVPDDYEQLKKQLENARRTNEDLITAAAEAAERAEAAEAELEAISAGTVQAEPAWKTIKMAVDRFMMDTNFMLSASPAELNRDRKRIRGNVDLIASWARAMIDVLDKAEQSDAFEGAVTVE